MTKRKDDDLSTHDHGTQHPRPAQSPRDQDLPHMKAEGMDEPSPRKRGAGRPFKPGETGNRKGRPKKPEPEIDFRKILLSEYHRLVSLPGTRGKVPAIQGVVRGTIMSAVKGNAKSQGEALAMYREISREREVLRDVVNAHAQDVNVAPEEILERLRAYGIEVPGNFEIIARIASEIARERSWGLKMEGWRNDAEEPRPPTPAQRPPARSEPRPASASLHPASPDAAGADGVGDEGAAPMSIIITQAQREALRALGYSDEAIRAMTPDEAHRHLGLKS